MKSASLRTCQDGMATLESGIPSVTSLRLGLQDIKEKILEQLIANVDARYSWYRAYEAQMRTGCLNFESDAAAAWPKRGLLAQLWC